MAEYEEVKESVEVPKNVGLPGFMAAIAGILKLPRVQEINIDARGKIAYRFFRRPEEEKHALAVDFESLMPYAIIRNGKVVELAEPDENAAVALAQLLIQASIDHLFPVAFVGGAKTGVWRWLEVSTALHCPVRDELLGVPFYFDRNVEDHCLMLCAGYARGGSIADTQKSYKLVVPDMK